jgi:hypothetical protein
VALIAGTAILVAGVAGCGAAGHHPSSGRASAAVTSELSYFAPGSPLLLTLATSPRSSAVHSGQSLEGQLPQATLAEAVLKEKLAELGIDYQTDIRPLFGNPLMLGFASASFADATSNLLAVWITRSASRLSALIHKLGLASDGAADGFALYPLGSSASLAIDGATVILGLSSSSVRAAIERHAQNQGFPTSEYTRLTGGLSANPLIEVWGDLTGVLSTASAVKARAVPWVGALRGYSASLTAATGAVNLDFRVDTGAKTLGSADLPIASGMSPPELAGKGPITIGLADPAHLATFVEAAQREVDPAGYAKFSRREARLRARTGVDVNNLISQLTGSLVISSNTHLTMARVGLANPSGAASILGKLLADASVAFGVKRERSLGGGFYAVASGSKRASTIHIGVVGDQLVAGQGSVAALRAFASAPESPAAKAQGSVAFEIALPDLLRGMGAGAGSATVQQALAILGAITGWAQASPAALTGEATLAVK